MTQRDLQNVSSIFLLRDSEVNSYILFSAEFNFPSNKVQSTSSFDDGNGALYLFIENLTLGSPGLVSKNGKLFTMIAYRNEPKLMKICINYSNTKHGNPVLEVEIDFAEYLKEFMFVELLRFSVGCILFHLFERFSFHTIGFLPTLSSPRLDLRNEDLFTVLIDFKRFAGVVSVLAILESVRKASEDQNKGLLTTDLLEGNRKHKGMEDMLKLSDTFKGVQPRPDVVNIEEAKSSLRETGGLNFEEAGALCGKYEYQKGKIEAAVRIFEESDGNLVFAEILLNKMLLRRLIEHLKFGIGTPLKKVGIKESYIFDLWAVFVIRVALGSGVALPSMNNMISKWFPQAEHARVVGMAMVGFELGRLAAIFSGDGIVITVSEHASWFGCLYFRIIQTALDAVGTPENLVDVITGFAEIGEALVSSVNKAIFIASPDGGKKIMRNASETLIPVTLKLGGKVTIVGSEDDENFQTLALCYHAHDVNFPALILESVVNVSKIGDSLAAYELSLQYSLQRELNAAPYYSKNFLKLESGSHIKGWLFYFEVLPITEEAYARTSKDYG